MKQCGTPEKLPLSAAQPIPNLTSGRLLASNTVWNLLGQVLPMAVAVIAIPPLIRALGVPRFGVLSLAWIVIGYFSLFDLGLGRALTKLVADKLGSRQEQSVPGLAWTALFLMLLLGILGSVVMLVLSPWLVYRALKIPVDLQPETLRSFYLLALSLPLVTVTSGLRGILEALQRFRLITLIRLPMSVFSFAGPLLILPFSRSLFWVMSVLILGRLVGCVAHLIACVRVVPTLRHIRLERTVVAPIFKFGGWMTVSNVINPLLVYADRFVIGALVSVSVIAYYTVPFDMVIRLTVVPGAVAGVLFPAFAMSILDDPARTRLLLLRSVKYIFLAIFPITLITVTLAPEGLRFWLGSSFADNSTSVLRWLAAGVLANSLAHAPFALVQSAGRPDLTAKLHLIELPLYLTAVWVLTKKMGIEGTAIACTARLVLDTVLICVFLDRMLPASGKLMTKIGAALSAGLLLLSVGTLPMGLTTKILFVGLGMSSFVLVGWFLVLSPAERLFLRRQKSEYIQV
ncbi:MAG TPA: flippase [Candidatus Angelobacter sp.]